MIAFFFGNSLKERKYILTIIGCCLLSYTVFLLFQFYFTEGQMGVPLDDTWIHFQFADNFSNGHFFEYNVGEPTAGTTSPLYVIILAAASFVSDNFIFNSIFISVVFHILSCILIFKLSLSIFSGTEIKKLIEKLGIDIYDASLLTGLLTVFSGRFVWAGMSGMETSMFTFFTIWAIYNYVVNKGKPSEIYGTSILLALCTISRPEGFLLFSIYVALRVFICIKEKSLRANFLKLFVSCFLFLVIALPYFIFSYKVSGHFFPNTFRGQGGDLHILPGLTYLRIVAVYFCRDNLVTGLFYLAGFVYLLLNIKKLMRGEFGNMTLILLWIFLLPLVSSFLVPNWRHHVRYMIPVVPFVNIAAVYFLSIFIQLPRLARIRNFLTPKPKRYATIIIASLIYYTVYAIAYGRNTDNINDQQVRLAEWVSKNVGREETIAVNDIGAIIYLNKNRVIDMAGLVTPEVLKYREYTWDDNLDSLNSLLKKNNVSYIIIYDFWFAEYMAKYGDELTFVTSAILEHNTICGGKEMKVFKTNFK